MEILRRIRREEREARKQFSELDKQTALFIVAPRIDELKEKYEEFKDILDYLESVQNDIVSNIGIFLHQDEDSSPISILKTKTSPFIRYKVNLIVNRREAEGSPVVEETNPTYSNLVGRVEYEGQLGLMVTDFTKIRAGAFHRANGGYLILQAKDVLTNAGAWDALKRILRDGSIKIESLGEKLGLVAIGSIKPEPIP